MRTAKEAYDIVQSAIKDTIFEIVSCWDIGESFVFVHYLKDGSGTNIPPFEVPKDENAEPDFYDGNFFFDCDEKYNSIEIPLKELTD